jgi:Transposase DDE domain
MFKSTCQKSSFLTLPDLDAIARQCGLVIRQSSKFSPAGFLQTLLGSVATGLASLNQLAGSLKDFTNFAMARQSLHERFNTCSTAFLIHVLSDLTEKRFQPVATALHASPIKRIVIEDASAQVMPKSNAKLFPAHGNHHGPTAGIKVDFAFDLLTGQILFHSLHNATEQDKTIGKECLTQVRAGDLVLRDMGYFVLSEFDEIERRGGYWLTRLPLSVGVVCGNDEALETILKHTRHDLLDSEVLVGDVQKKCRLIAVRAAPEVAKARRAQRRKTACESGKKPCPKGLVRDGWHLMLTNLSKEQASVSQLTAVYRARWAVEIQFRGWKQALNLGKALNRKSNEHHMQALVLAAMIAHQLGMRVGAQISALASRAKVSYEKLYDLFALHLIKARDIAELCDFAPELRHVTRDKRTRLSPVESGILALT